MEKLSCNNCSSVNNGIVLACSGASDLGEITDRVARKLRDNKVYNMKCLAMVAAADKSLVEALKTSETLVIDGCNVDCGRKIMEEAWLTNYKYVRLTDLGYVKGQTPVTEELIDRIYDQITNPANDNRITNDKPTSSNCCS